MTIELTAFSTDIRDTRAGVDMTIDAESGTARLAFTTFMSQCAAYAVDALNAGQRLEVPGTTAPLAPAPSIDLEMLRTFAEDLLAGQAAKVDAPLTDDAPAPKPRRKRRTRAEIDAAEALAAKEAAGPPLPFEDKTVVVTAAPPEPEPEPEPAPKAKAKRTTVQTSQLTVRDESFTVVWSQTGVNVSGKVIIAEAQAERLGGKAETIVETGENRTEVKPLLTERIEEYLDAAVYAQQQGATALPAAEPDPGVVWVSVDLLKHVTETRKPDSNARAVALRLWTTHLFNTRAVNGIADGDACAVWILKNQDMVTWFADNPLKANAQRNISGTWRVLEEGEAAAVVRAAASQPKVAAASDDIFDIDEDDIGYGMD